MDDQVWPSKRVSQGGFLKPAKATYSKDTQDLIKLLMEESKLSMMQRKSIDYHLRSGNPLPSRTETQHKPVQYDFEQQQAYEIIKRAQARNGRKKNLNAIIESGAFEVERYIPKSTNQEPCERAKIRLQAIMSGIEVHPQLDHLNPSNKYKYRKVPKAASSTDCIAQLLNEIFERADWLAEMEELGEGRKHREVIHLQIASRLREIKRLEKDQKTDTPK